MAIKVKELDKEPEIPTLTQVVSNKTLPTFKDKTPSNWTLIELEEGIFARNSLTNEKFTGSILEFNKCLRG